jgi:hypothetical protein
MKPPRLILLLTLLTSNHLAVADPSLEIKLVLKERLAGKHDLRLDGLTREQLTPEQSKRLEDKSSYEAYAIPYPKNVADYFAYAIYRFKATGEIWIVRTGGFAGVRELYIVRKPQS